MLYKAVGWFANSAVVLCHLLRGVALLNEGGPDGSWSNGIHSDASTDQVGAQALSEGRHRSLHDR